MTGKVPKGDKTEVIRATFTDMGLDFPVSKVVEALASGPKGIKVSRPLVYRVLGEMKAEMASASQMSFTTLDLRRAKKFAEDVGSLAKAKLLLETLEELSKDLHA